LIFEDKIISVAFNTNHVKFEDNEF